MSDRLRTWSMQFSASVITGSFLCIFVTAKRACQFLNLGMKFFETMPNDYTTTQNSMNTGAPIRIKYNVIKWLNKKL